MNKSIWNENKNTINTTTKNIETDILIIGGGITGMTSLLYLLNEKKKITLIEANRIGTGITNKTTAKINIIQEYNYQKIKNTINTETSQKYLQSQIYATKEILKLIKNYKIECDLEKNDSYLFTNDKKNIKKIKKEKQILEKYIKCEEVLKLPNKYPCIYGIKTKSYVFNPIKYINKIKNICKNKINIFENTRALQISKKLDYYLIKTNKNKIKAKQIIICTHYPIFINKLSIPIKTTIEKEYILSAQTDNTYNTNMISNDNEIISIRYYKNNIIYASNKTQLGNELDHKKNMEDTIKKFKKHFNYPITHTWYNFDIISNDYLPIIGKIKKENILIATAYNKWGMTNSILAAKIITDIIRNKENEFIELVNPYRKTNIKKIIKNINYNYDNIKTYIKNKKQKNITYKIENGIEYAIYIDQNKKEHKIINKCPHLKCKLIFNELDKTWDCPCHGSRYTIDGKIIKGPSTYSIKPKRN